MDNAKTLFTAREAAEYLNLSYPSLVRRINRGQLKAIKVKGRGREEYRIKAIDLENAPARNKRHASTKTSTAPTLVPASVPTTDTDPTPYVPSDLPTPMILTRDGRFLSYTVKEANDRGIDWVEAGTIRFVPEFTRRTRVVELTEVLDADGNVAYTEEKEKE